MVIVYVLSIITLCTLIVIAKCDSCCHRILLELVTLIGDRI